MISKTGSSNEIPYLESLSGISALSTITRYLSYVPKVVFQYLLMFVRTRNCTIQSFIRDVSNVQCT